ncbi:MAG TPA: HAMP domain-containing sensor histidine kinase [Methylomirabilota bacterium]|nr:HAMP domain-containing sensor histidine kinase [Methylomirabilota bacterium]
MRHGPPWMREGSMWSRSGQRPPWWPENEPYPPADWRPLRVRFMRRMAAFALVAFLLFAFAVAAFLTLLIGTFGAVSGGGGVGAFVLAAFLVLVVSFNVARGIRRLVAPLGDLIDAAERVESGDYSVRVPVRGPRELRALGRAFNEMSAHLEGSEAERKRLLADVTHELRTPLTVIQGNIEAIIDEVHPPDAVHLRAILAETQVLSRLIDDLRTVSIADAGALTLHREEIEVGRLIRDNVASFDPQATAAGVTLSVDADGAGIAMVDPIRLREVLNNVIANALRYTPRGGSIVVGASGDDQRVTVTVRDTGAGIAPDVLPHIFDRFTHAPDSPGAGLGLAIAKSLVTAHGGEISATSTLGQGTEVRFTLPRQTAAI